MLTELRIRNLAVIDSVALSLDRGLNVLTGETGAGKSIIVGALSFLLGDRASADRIRTGEEKASVEGTFTVPVESALHAVLDARGIETEGATVVLRREVTSAGRSRAWVNGTQVTATVLSEIGDSLVSIYGQNESRQLTDREVQRNLLDRFAGSLELAATVRSTYGALQRAIAEEQSLIEAREQAAERAAFLRAQLHEIDEARPEAGEEERIDGEISRLAHAEDLQADALEAVRLLSGGEFSIHPMLRNVRRLLSAIARVDSERETWPEAIDEISIMLDELARDIDDYRAEIEVDPARLRRLEGRRQQLTLLLRKYGPTIPEALTAAGEMRNELSLLGGHDNRIVAVARERKELEVTLRSASQSLSRARIKGASEMSRGVTALLPELGMPSAQFMVELVPVQQSPAVKPEAAQAPAVQSVALQPPIGAITAGGAESVLFVASLNSGTDAKPVDRIASGGELSRLMLALSTILSRAQEVPTLVFDEIDAGVGGAVAWQVGALMKQLAGSHQVFAISHLAQIAAQAHHHISVSKGAVDGVTSADTEVLLADNRMLEIARMLGGDAESEVSQLHARELLERGDTGVVRTSPTRRQRRGKPV